MRNLAILALMPAEKIQCQTGSGEVSLGVQGERCPESVAAEEPIVAGTAVTRVHAITRDQSLAQKWIVHYGLRHVDTRPVIGLLQLRIRYFKLNRVTQVLVVIS